MSDIVDLIHKFKESIRNDYLDRLGSLGSEQFNLGRCRVASDQKVPGIRNLGHTPSAVYIDEPYHITAYDRVWLYGAPASIRLEHRMLRGGDVPSRLSRGAYEAGWKSSLSPAVTNGYPRIEVEL